MIVHEQIFVLAKMLYMCCICVNGSEQKRHVPTKLSKRTVHALFVSFSLIEFYITFNQSVGEVKMGERKEKPPGEPARRPWIVSHVPSVGLIRTQQ